MALTLDVFKSDAFTTVELTNSINLIGHVPGFLGNLGLFTYRPVSVPDLFVEERGDKLVIIPNRPRGGVPQPLQATGTNRRRVARSFRVTHLPQNDFIPADEILGVRAFGSQSELEVVGQKVNERFEMMRRNVELTWENLMLGCVKGTILDSDGTTTIYNLFTEFNVTQETEIDFDLDAASPASGALRKKCDDATRKITRNAKGANANLRIIGICGDAFWDDLVAHSEVRNTYLNWVQAQDLRMGTAFRTMMFGGIDWYNYRGTDDNTTLLVNTDKCHLFPLGVPGLFDMYFAPANKTAFVNTLGLPLYAFQYLHPKDEGVDLEVQSNPLPLCTQPLVLVQGRRT